MKPSTDSLPPLMLSPITTTTVTGSLGNPVCCWVWPRIFKLAAATLGRSVAFEVDGYEPADGEAWSVVVKGRAVEIERHEQQQRHDRRRGEHCQEATAENGDVQREQADCNRCAEHLQQEDGTRDTVVQRREA